MTNPALQTASVGSAIERATFDPEWGLDDPDVTVLDLGHPLVRRLIEEVKQEAFRAASAEHYGRTGFLVTEDAEQVTAVFHLLARYVVQTDPVSIVEELLPVAVPVYGTNALERTATRRLLRAEPSAQTRTTDEVRETISEALEIPGLEDLLAEAVARRREELAAERQEMRRRLEEQADGQTTAWLRGIDDFAEGSFDMLALTIYYPA